MERVFLILGLLCIAGVILLLIIWDRPRKQKTHRQSLPPSRWPEHPDL